MANEARTCRTCNVSKSLAEGFRKVRGKYFWKCKACVDAANQKWIEANRDKVAAIKRRYVETHPDKVKEASLRYARSARGREFSRRWKSENREIINDRCRAQYASDPIPFHLRIDRRNRAEKTAPGIFTKTDERSMFVKQNGRCANPKCHADIAATGYHADHIIPLSRGGSHWPNNRQLLCPTCNHVKYTKTNAEWLGVAV